MPIYFFYSFFSFQNIFLGGGKCIPQDLKDSIYTFLCQNSSIASNKLAVNRDKSDDNFLQKQPVRYLDDLETELFKSFPFSNEISKSTFHKYLKINGVYKKSYKWTDLCDYCEKGKKLRIELIKLLEEQNFEWNENFELQNLIKIFIEKRNYFDKTNSNNSSEIDAKKKQIETILVLLKDLESIEFHKNISKNQRKIYVEQITNKDLLSNKVLIECDFKQKILIGTSPKQVNSEYYGQKLRSCLGFGVYFVKENKTQLINFDIISSDLNEDARSVVRGFRLLREQNFFKTIDKKSYIIWMDCGKHFRNNEVIGYLLKELSLHGIQGL